MALCALSICCPFLKRSEHLSFFCTRRTSRIQSHGHLKSTRQTKESRRTPSSYWAAILPETWCHFVGNTLKCQGGFSRSSLLWGKPWLDHSTKMCFVIAVAKYNFWKDSYRWSLLKPFLVHCDPEWALRFTTPVISWVKGNILISFFLKPLFLSQLKYRTASLTPGLKYLKWCVVLSGNICIASQCVYY